MDDGGGETGTVRTTSTAVAVSECGEERWECHDRDVEEKVAGTNVGDRCRQGVMGL